MSATPEVVLMTTEEMLALPDSGVERGLIRGQLREKPTTVRNRWHSSILTRLAQVLRNWLDTQPEPRGDVLGGEAGCRLRRNPDVTVGIDLTYISAELAGNQSEETTLIEGIPVLAVEILSPSDTNEEIHEKIDEYLRAGVRLVWIVDRRDETVRVYRPKQKPVLFNADQELNGEDALPGFRVKVADIFR